MLTYKKSLSTENGKSISFGAGSYITVARTDQINLGELYVPPHSTAGYDPGHPGADEVFFVKCGVASVEFPETQEKESVETGHYILMPRGKAHVVHNEGDDDLTIVFFGVLT